MFNGYRVLDVHGHVSIPQEGYFFGMFLLGSNYPADSPIGVKDAPWVAVPPESFQRAAQEHVAYLDARGIDVQIIGPRPYVTLGWMEDHLIPSWTRYVNDAIAQQVGFFPDRFLGACQLPMDSAGDDTSHCLDELDRCVQDLGFVAAYVSPDPGGRRTTPGMHEPYWYPLYRRCEELDVPIIVHGSNSLDRRFRIVPANYQLGFVIEQYLAGQFLGHSDVFDRFPRLKVLLCHGGGALNRFIPTDYHLPQRDLSANLFYDTCVYDEHLLEATIKQRGIPQLCFGTEAPGSGGSVRPETRRTADDMVPVLDAVSFLTDADKRWIFHDGPIAMFPALERLQGSAP